MSTIGELDAHPAQAADGPDLAAVADDLRAARKAWRAAHRPDDEHGSARYPARREIEAIVADLAGALFPMRLGTGGDHADGEDAYVTAALERALRQLRGQVRLERGGEPPADAIVTAFAHGLAASRRLLDADVEAAFAGDPAARSVDEVLLCYPGVQALVHHRLAHRLHTLGAPLVARIVAEIAHSATGIDIHPGARIGRSCFIDHGSGVVIGETAVIGDRVRLYQAVTLGARSFPAEADGSLVKGLARHPIIEDDVVIYAGATILGRVTVGAGSVIGGNVWLTEDVPPRSVIHQAFAERAHAAASLPIGHVVAEAGAIGAPRG